MKSTTCFQVNKSAKLFKSSNALHQIKIRKEKQNMKNKNCKTEGKINQWLMCFAIIYLIEMNNYLETLNVKEIVHLCEIKVAA